MRAAGWGLAAVTKDEPEVLRAFGSERGLTYPLFAGKALIEQLGLVDPAFAGDQRRAGAPVPVILLVDAEARITHRFYERDGWNLASVLARVEGVRAPEQAAWIETPQVDLRPWAPPATVRPGQRVSLALDLRPQTGMHVYAPGKHDYTPVSLSVQKTGAFAPLGVDFPAAEQYTFKPLNETVPVFIRQVTVFQDIVVAGDAPSGPLVIRGAATTQACDDRVCYPERRTPVEWHLFVERQDTRGSAIRINGADLHVTSEGAGQPVILLHGGFMDSTMWDAQAAALAREFQVIRFDFRGFGRSAKPAGPYLPGDDIAAVLDHLKIARAAVVGLSMGGGVAIEFALAHPNRVTALLVAEPGLSGHTWSEEVTSTMQAVMRAAKERGRQAAIEEFLNRPVFASARNNPAAYAAIRAQLERNFSLEPNQMDGPLAIDRLTGLKLPTLVLVSEHGGPDAPAIASRIKNDVPHARLMTIAGSGHMMNFERPAEFNRIVLEFLREHASLAQ